MGLEKSRGRSVLPMCSDLLCRIKGRLQKLTVSPGLVFLLAVAVNTLFFALVYKLFVCLGSNDDITLSFFVNGAFGQTDFRVPYNNFLYALIIRGIYSLLGSGFSWYMIVQYLLLILSYSACCTMLIIRQEIKKGVVLSLILLAGFAFGSYLRVTFTLVAEVTACTGMLLLTDAAGVLSNRGTSGKSVWLLAGGLLLSLTGFMMRWNAAAPCYVLMAVLLLPFLSGSGDWTRLIRFCVPFMVLLVLAGALFTADRILWNKEEYRQWEEINKSRTELKDYSVTLPYADAQEEYDAAGILESEVSVCNLYAITDPEVFTDTFFQKMTAVNREIMPKGQGVFKSLATLVDTVSGAMVRKPFFTAAALAFLLWLSAGSETVGTKLPALWILLFSAFYFYLVFRGRYGLDRVDQGLTFSGFLVAAMLPLPKDRRFSKRFFVLGLASLCFIVHLCQPRSFLRVNSDIDPLACSQEIERKYLLLSTKEETVFLDAQMLFRSLDQEPTYGMTEGILRHVIPLSGWMAQHPLQHRTLLEHGINNPYRDSIGREDVCWVSNNIDIITDYIRQHYEPDARAEIVEPLSTEAGVGIYRIVV